MMKIQREGERRDKQSNTSRTAISNTSDVTTEKQFFSKARKCACNVSFFQSNGYLEIQGWWFKTILVQLYIYSSTTKLHISEVWLVLALFLFRFGSVGDGDYHRFNVLD